MPRACRSRSSFSLSVSVGLSRFVSDGPWTGSFLSEAEIADLIRLEKGLPLGLTAKGRTVRYAKNDERGWLGGHHAVISGTRGGKGVSAIMPAIFDHDGPVHQAFVAHGMIADVAIHAPHRQGDGRNHHAHVMLTMREITADGFGKKERAWNETALIEHWREAWETAVNRALERAGRAERVDHRSLEEQRAETLEKAETARAANDNVQARVFDLDAARLDRDPEPKIGHIAMALERRGEATERGNNWRAVVARNLDRFLMWIAFQRKRLEELWERFEKARGLLEERDREARQDRREPRSVNEPQLTPELRDRLLGRERDPKSGRRSGKDERER